MTTLFQAQPPVLCYEVYFVDDRLYGYCIDNSPWHKVRNSYPVVYDLKGQHAHYLIVSNDPAVLRHEAIDFARALYERRCQTISISFEQLNERTRQDAKRGR